MIDETPRRKVRPSLSKDDLNELGVLLSPSWLSGFVAMVASLALVSGASVLLHYNGSSWQLLLTGQRHQVGAIETNFVDFEHKFDTNVLISNLPLFIFWAGIGIIVYYLILAVINALRSVAELEEEMKYVHADRHILLRQALLHLFVRISSLVVWIFYVRFTLHLLLPYTIALSYAGSGDSGWLYDILYLISAVALGAITLHVHTVLLRLLVLKPRIFGQDIKD